MLPRPRGRFPFYLKAALTALSATGLILAASGFSPASKAALTDSASASASPQERGETLQQQKAAGAHLAHLRHLQHVAHVTAAARRAAAARAYAAYQARQLKLRQEEAPVQRTQPPAPETVTGAASAQAPQQSPSYPAPVSDSGAGTLSAAEVGELWLEAGGPAWAEPHAVEIARCESGFNPRAYNPSGATGLWQILGSVVGGDLTSPPVNAANAVAKFKASGDTFAQWVCQ